MPHRLIYKLQALTQFDFPAAPSSDVVLGERDCGDLPEKVFDLLDEVQEAARSVFGFAAPKRAQEHMLEKAGFAVHWQSGIITTPKGSVRYKE